MSQHFTNARVRVWGTDENGQQVSFWLEGMDLEYNPNPFRHRGAQPATVLTITGATDAPPAPTLTQQMGHAALEGDDMAALALSDEIQGRHNNPAGFVSRADLLRMLKRSAWWDEHNSGRRCCRECRQDLRVGHTDNCKLALALRPLISDRLSV